ncbi:ribbon-helix-helix domain-containing protein [Deferribacteres bacterium DY0037]
MKKCYINKKLQVFIDENMYTSLQRIACKTGRTNSEIIREAVTNITPKEVHRSTLCTNAKIRVQLYVTKKIFMKLTTLAKKRNLSVSKYVRICMHHTLEKYNNKPI